MRVRSRVDDRTTRPSSLPELERYKTRSQTNKVRSTLDAGDPGRGVDSDQIYTKGRLTRAVPAPRKRGAEATQRAVRG